MVAVSPFTRDVVRGPCGIADRGVRSLERLLGRRVPMAEVEEAVATLHNVVETLWRRVQLERLDWR